MVRSLQSGVRLPQGEDRAAARGRDGPRNHHEGHPQREGPFQGAPGLRRLWTWGARARHPQAHVGVQMF